MIFLSIQLGSKTVQNWEVQTKIIHSCSKSAKYCKLLAQMKKRWGENIINKCLLWISFFHFIFIAKAEVKKWPAIGFISDVILESLFVDRAGTHDEKSRLVA